MGASCSGEEREAYFREQEALRDRELAARPIVVQRALPTALAPKAVTHPAVQHRLYAAHGQATAFSEAVHPADRPRLAAGAFGYVDEHDVYAAHRDEVGQRESGPLTNSAGAFFDPRMVDKFYDVSISHVITAAQDGSHASAHHTLRSTYNNSSLHSTMTTLAGRQVVTSASIPTWQHLQAIPYPVGSDSSLPPLPYTVHGALHNSLHAPEGGSATSGTLDPAEMNSLRWKPKFSLAVSTLSKDPNDLPPPGASREEKAQRKAARAQRRKEREEATHAQERHLKDMRARAIAAGKHHAAAAMEEKESLNAAATATVANAALAAHAPAPSPSSSLNFSYERDDDAPIGKQPPPTTSRSEATSTARRAAAATPVKTTPPKAAGPSSHGAGSSAGGGGGALSHFFSTGNLTYGAADDNNDEPDSRPSGPVAVPTSIPVNGQRRLSASGERASRMTTPQKPSQNNQQQQPQRSRDASPPAIIEKSSSSSSFRTNFATPSAPTSAAPSDFAAFAAEQQRLEAEALRAKQARDRKLMEEREQQAKARLAQQAAERAATTQPQQQQQAQQQQPQFSYHGGGAGGIYNDVGDQSSRDFEDPDFASDGDLAEEDDDELFRD